MPEDGAAGEGDAGTKETPAEEIIPGEEDVTEEGEPTAEPETQKEEKAEDNSFDPE